MKEKSLLCTCLLQMSSLHIKYFKFLVFSPSLFSVSGTVLNSLALLNILKFIKTLINLQLFICFIYKIQNGEASVTHTFILHSISDELR